jgi:hypothetical protein
MLSVVKFYFCEASLKFKKVDHIDADGYSLLFRFIKLLLLLLKEQKKNGKSFQSDY